MPKAFSNVVVFVLLVLTITVADTRYLIASNKITALPQKEGQCGYKSVRVIGDALVDGFDYCRPLFKVMAYFRSMGFEFEPKFSLIIASKSNSEQSNSYGTFDAEKDNITIYPIGEKKPWNLIWNEEVYSSIVIHEMVHMAVLDILDKNYDRLPKEWHEFIAYSIQIALLKERLRDEVLSKYNNITAFDNLLNLNPILYNLAASDRFSVMAYKTYQARGGSTFIRNLLLFKFQPPNFLDLFPF